MSKLESLMFDTEIFTNPELKLNDLLSGYHINKSLLMRFLKANNYANYSEFVNSKRVEAFKEIVVCTESQKYDLFSLAKEAGFKSKASFYRVFKKTEGITPLQYQKSMLNQSQT